MLGKKFWRGFTGALEHFRGENRRKIKPRKLGNLLQSPVSPPMSANKEGSGERVFSFGFVVRRSYFDVPESVSWFGLCRRWLLGHFRNSFAEGYCQHYEAEFYGFFSICSHLLTE